MKSVVFSLCLFGLMQAFSMDSVAAFSLKGENLLTGHKQEFSIKSKGIVLVFLSARCPCSNSHVPVVKKLSEDFPEFQFVAIHSNADEAKDLALPYFKSQELGFPIIEDEKSALANRYKASKTPHAFVLSPDGSVVYKGGVTSSADAPSAERQYLRIALNELLAGHKVSQSETRSLGCAIARGENYVW